MAFVIDPWLIREEVLNKESMRLSESLTSIANGYMGMRGNFEEDYSGDCHLGQYIGGVWFPDKTRVGWWKNGYPEYFGKAINCVRLNGIHVEIDGINIDLNTANVQNFSRQVDMHNGLFKREFIIKTDKGKVKIVSERFVSLAEKELLAISYKVEADYKAELILRPYIDANVKNLDSNYDEVFWEMLDQVEMDDTLSILTRTKENPFGAPRFTVSAAMTCWSDCLDKIDTNIKEGYVEYVYKTILKENDPVTLEKFVLCFTNRDVNEISLIPRASRAVAHAKDRGYFELRNANNNSWLERWNNCDVIIDGDDAAQQGIRFNIFHLLSTYSGDDSRLNIGPKGFTGEKYGGATYWDTEAYCLPVYMAIAGEDVAKQLLTYRYTQLPQAYENAKAQGLKGALYPMVTFTGLECHNEWEITFEEIHRNGAIVYAIFNYTTYTGNTDYILNEGLDVICGVARFYADRVHYSNRKQKWMIHGVTGPNEYENNVNNNWYTNRLAAWCLSFFTDLCKIASKVKLSELDINEDELKKMREISTNMYYAVDDNLNIFIQHDTFMDKDLMPSSELPNNERPINQHWSWDKVLRSCFIKQADVLQGLYFFNHLYDNNTIKANFDFYEPMTVHESSLSPCVHSILASQLGYTDKAIEMYLRTSRLDLDNINNDTLDGLHITSMAGSWLSMTQGFAGMRTIEGLSFAPFLPSTWKGYSFQITYRNRLLCIIVKNHTVTINLINGKPLILKLYDEEIELKNTIVKELKVK